MSHPETLFDMDAPVRSGLPDAPYQKGSETSRAAAESVADAMPALEAKVLAAIRAAGDAGMTDLEIERATSLAGSTARPRRIRLEDMGLVADSGERRLSPSGRQCVVWRCV